MRQPRTDLEKLVSELRNRSVQDLDTLAELSQTLWKLERQDEAVEAFCRLLEFEASGSDAAFDKIYVSGLLATVTCPTPVRRRDRLMLLVELLRDTTNVPGEVVECGCYRGLSSYLLCSYLRHWDNRFDGRGYHIFDSFQGLSEPTEDDEIPDDWMHAKSIQAMIKPGNFAATLEQVTASLREFPGISFHPGWIPLSFRGLPEACYRFVHVDVDLYDPTLDSFEYFYPRLSDGGMIVCDDYGWPGARQAVEEFCERHSLRFESNRFNQAVLRNS